MVGHKLEPERTDMETVTIIENEQDELFNMREMKRRMNDSIIQNLNEKLADA